MPVDPLARATKSDLNPIVLRQYAPGTRPGTLHSVETPRGRRAASGNPQVIVHALVAATLVASTRGMRQACQWVV
jgi:hypothetical protein